MDVEKDEYCSVVPMIGVHSSILCKTLEWAKTTSQRRQRTTRRRCHVQHFIVGRRLFEGRSGHIAPIENCCCSIGAKEFNATNNRMCVKKNNRITFLFAYLQIAKRKIKIIWKILITALSKQRRDCRSHAHLERTCMSAVDVANISQPKRSCPNTFLNIPTTP